jgi:hypothetical protein
MSIKIDKTIVNYEIAKADNAAQTSDATGKADGTETVPEGAEIIQMHEKLARPDGLECLEGATYKIKTPLEEHALYVTINDIVLNLGSEHEVRKPFEIFINSKNMDHFQWIVALTRVMSAVFRKGGDVTFMAEELQAVFDPRGGYFKAGGKFMPSLVAEIGAVVEHHMKRIGLIVDEPLSSAQQKMLGEKRAQAELAERDDNAPGSGDQDEYPASATLCKKCNTRATVFMDGCETCLSCGYSKCS